MKVEQAKKRINEYRSDWCLFAKEVLGVTLDEEQQAILRSVQVNKMTSVASGTARGKDFISAVACLCFLYLTPRWNTQGEMVANTKVAMTAPTDRQVKNIMVPEVSRLFYRAKKRGVDLPGRITGHDIRTGSDEWFLTGFKADEHNHEAWSGFHAANTMFVVTEASGLPETVFNAIEGNLQGNSRILIVFNPNTPVGYAARSQKSDRWHRFQLNSLNAVNVKEKREVIPGQVDYEWVVDKVKEWAMPISPEEVTTEENDFEFEGRWYRPNDLFRVKVLGLFPKVSEDTLIPAVWIEAANKRWREQQSKPKNKTGLRLGVDVAGMGRDSSVFCYRYSDYVDKFWQHNSGGKANHMEIAGKVKADLSAADALAFIDTIGEGAGVWSRLEEQGMGRKALSCKYSESAKDYRGHDLTDSTGQYLFANMRAYLFWAVREWLDPKNNTGAALPPDTEFMEEATEIKWKFQSNGKIIIEKKEDIIKRLKRSTDKFDSLANTFMPFKPKTNNLNILSSFQ
ncbi:hypothetical protein Q4E40_02650 [Pontibacter sp. BT731]|uniref:hypothetical protein n=1 Tax=Pontibacter coccineus TaxID=3063328 RepID=UPI0026E30047|nr:hypothetical protein [Pontibacter sp. BT731]MDO6389012.1 hypothetical protein [Pontibacter sp. BT731]